MFEYLIIGSSFALSAAIQPGPLQAFLLSSVAKRGWIRTLPASFAPVLSDGPIALLVLLALNHVPETANRCLQTAGGVLLLYLAWATYKEWKHPSQSAHVEDGSVPSTLFQAAAVNILNPNPYLAWSLVLGPAFLRAWHDSPQSAIVFVLAFYATMVTALAGTILLLGTTRFLGPRGRRGLILASAVTLGLLGLYQLISGLARALGV